VNESRTDLDAMAASWRSTGRASDLIAVADRIPQGIDRSRVKELLGEPVSQSLLADGGEAWTYVRSDPDRGATRIPVRPVLADGWIRSAQPQAHRLGDRVAASEAGEGIAPVHNPTDRSGPTRKTSCFEPLFWVLSARTGRFDVEILEAGADRLFALGCV
jgi:hypothetical protein